MNADAVRAAVGGYYDAMRRMDQEAWVASFAPDGQSRLFEGAPARGHDALRRLYRNFAGAFETVGLFEDRVSVDGCNAVVYWTAKAVSHQGKDLIFNGVDAFEVADGGKITLHWSCWDPSDVMAEL